MDARSRRPVGRVFPRMGDEGRARDVEVGPFDIFRYEFAEKERGENRARAFAHIRKVREIVLEFVGVFLVEGHRPEFFARGLARLHDHFRESVVVREKSGDGCSQRADHRAGESRHGNDVGRSVFDRRADAVGKDEPSLRVRVVDHDGFAVLRLENVAGEDRSRAYPVFGEAEVCGHLEGNLELRRRADGGERGGGSRHVALHFAHSLGGFQGNSARIKRDALSDEREVLVFRRVLRVVGKLHHAWFEAASGTDGQETVETFPRENPRIENRDGKARNLVGDADRRVGEFVGIELCARRIHEILAEARVFLLDFDRFRNLFEILRAFPGFDFECDLESVFGRALEFFEAVCAVMESVENRSELFVRGVREKNFDRLELFLRCAFSEAVSRHPEMVEVGKSAFLRRVDENRCVAVDFHDFPVRGDAVFDILERSCRPDFALFGKHGGKLDRPFDKE